MQPVGFLLLEHDASDRTAKYMKDRGWLATDEVVASVTRAGEGNMNLVLRVQTDVQSVILKQSRPWVEKYPSIEAPVDRMSVEAAFYDALGQIPELRQRMPRLIDVDAANYAALFEDLGDVEDFTFLYTRRLEPPEPLAVLAEWLSTLHRTAFPGSLRPVLANHAMRRLNHAHLYDIPLRPNNGLDLDGITPGLQVEADRLKTSLEYKGRIEELGELYLDDGPVLLHGDFYPGSWVQTESGPGVIDPEFGFFGPAEYDVGVMRAHLIMAGYDKGSIDGIFRAYEPPAGFDKRLESGFAGMEIMRRLIGVAQLPMQRSINQKRALLQLSERLVLDSC